MAEISRVALFGKLNALGYRAIESASVFCKLRGNPYIELTHWFHQILQLQDSDLHRIIKHFGIDPASLARDLTEALDALPRGSTSVTDISSQVEETVERGWVYGSLLFNESQVRTGHLIVGMLKTPSLRNGLRGISRQFDRVKLDDLVDGFASLLGASPEASMTARDGFRAGAASGDDAGGAGGALAPAAMGRSEALKRYTVDLTEQAKNGKLDPIVGRDEEIRQVVDILMRRRQNNPLLTGEAGVGKTAVVEGLAQRIVAGDVPPSLRGVSLRTLDVGLLQAGASMKGEFENRLRQVIEEVQGSEKPVILFIDEAHTLVGAGGAAGTGDAANLLKPALARGTLRTVGATTWAEYKKHIEKDPALTRRFQVVQVARAGRGKGDPDDARHRLDAGAASSRAGARRGDGGGGAAVASLYPGAPVAGQVGEPARHRVRARRGQPARDARHRRRCEKAHRGPRNGTGDHRARDGGRHRYGRARVAARRRSSRASATGSRCSIAAGRRRRHSSSASWNCARNCAARRARSKARQRQRSNRAQNHGPPNRPRPDDPALRAERLAELRKLQAQLAEHQGEDPLILPSVDRQAVASVVQDWTGIPVGRMVKNEIESVLQLAATLNKRIIGQDHAMEMIARRIQTSRAGLDNPSKPIGVFMLAGTSGVGKTETALALAEALYGGEQNVITINMSEYQEAHTVSSLKGAPPGYVGYGEGGVLTEAVRRRPYSVVLLDEVEKAHPDVHEIFFQVFDKGWMEDGEGRVIDFRNTLILLTTNAGTDLIMNLCKDPELMPEPEGIARALREPLLKVFPPALLGRVVVIPYYPLSDAMLGAIIRLQLGRIERRVRAQHKIPFTYDDDVVKLIASRCTELESGGRMIDAILTNTLLPRISAEFLGRMVEGRTVAKVGIGAQEGEFTYAFD